jgi:voltage-gated potassium channel
MRPRDDSLRRFVAPLLLLVATNVIGVIGYMLIEGWSFSDALFMVATSATTVGFGEVRPLSDAGRIFTILLILMGLASIYYLFGTGIGIVFEGQVNRRWEGRRMQHRVDELRDHFIICGFGRVGQEVALTLLRRERPFVVIDTDPDAATDFAGAPPALVVGSATEDATLRRAGIERARGLITAVATDADNVFVTLSARALRPDLPIVARANHDDVIPKLRRAGATQVVSPYAKAGETMATLATRPPSVSFAETLLDGRTGSLILEDVEVATGSPLVGVLASDARREFARGAVFLAVRREDQVIAPPPTDLTFAAGDVIAAAGTREQLRALEEACAAMREA